MKSFHSLLVSVVLMFYVKGSLLRRVWVTTDGMENHINPEDLREFYSFYENHNSTTTSHPDNTDVNAATTLPVPELVDCFGLDSLSRTMLKFFNMKPDDAQKVNTHFYFSSRLRPNRDQVYPEEQFKLEWVDYKPTRKTVMIVHGYMSHSNASWVLDMTRAFLEWGDVNVIAVDWSGGGNTWKYWRAVANTRRVGADITRFLRQLMQATGAKVKDFHFVGHSLGAHILSYASNHLGKVARITGLDPAQQCFETTSDVERLDKTDADFVDIIHTNGRYLQKTGFGIPEPMGHIDFYPNGGLKQPGCFNVSRSLWSRMIGPFSTSRQQAAVCSHGRAYVLFTESLINNNCSFRAYRWDLSYEGVNKSLNSTCDAKGSCAEMGINALWSPKAQGPYFLLTTDKEPYCVSPKERRFPLMELLRHLRKVLVRSNTTRPPMSSSTAQVYAYPDLIKDLSRRPPILSSTTQAYTDPNLIENPAVESTTKKSWFGKLFGG